MLVKILDIKRDYSAYSNCSSCFAASNREKMFIVEVGFENNGNKNTFTFRICQKCLKELNEKINEIL